MYTSTVYTYKDLLSMKDTYSTGELYNKITRIKLVHSVHVNHSL